MSQVATQPSSTSASNLISQRVHTLDASNGLGNAESSLPLKSVGTRQATPTVTDPQTLSRVRRSQRLVKKSTRFQNEVPYTTTQRHSTKPRQRQARHSGQSTSGSSVVISSDTASPAAPSLAHTLSNEQGPTSSNSITSSSSAAPPLSDMMTLSGDHAAPQLLDLTRTSGGGANPLDDDRSDASSISSVQAQAGSPIQIEHSYALTFSSTAALLNDSEMRYHETPPQDTPLSTLQPTSVPVSVIRNTSPHSDNCLPHLQDQRSGRGHGSSSSTAGGANETRMLGTETESSERVSHPQHRNRGLGNHHYNSGTASRGLPSVALLSNMEHDSHDRPALPPYMLSSVEPNAGYGLRMPHYVCGTTPINLPAGHAQSNTIAAVGGESVSSFNASSPPISGTFEAPEPVLLTHYPSGSDVHVRATANGSVVGWAERERQRFQNLIASHSRERADIGHERERQRLENSTAFIASRSRERVRSGHRRARRRERHGEQTPLPVEETSATSEHGAQRDRSPTGGRASSRSGTRSHRRRPRPTSHVVDAVPLPSLNLHVRDVPTGSTRGTLGYQIVPQSSLVSAGVSSSGSLSSLSQPPPLQQIPLHVPHRHISVPATSTVQLQFQMTPRVSRNSSEPMVQLTSAQPDLLMSYSGSPFHPPPASQSIASTASEPYSGSPFHPPPTSQSISSTASEPYSGSPFHPPPASQSISSVASEPVSHSSTSLPVFSYVPQQLSEQATSSREILTVDNDFQTVPQHGVPRRRQSLVEVIIVDSSDSEDDDVIVSHVSHVHPSSLPSRQSREQISSDEVLARQLQEQFDRELRGHVIHSPGAPVAAGPSIPLPRPSRSNTDGSNYEALVSHVDRLTQNDARRLLRVAQFDSQRRTGRRPRTTIEFFRAMESMGEALLVNAILGRTPRSTYEDLLELAETLGPARPQGLPQEVINSLPLKEFSRSSVATDSGEQPKCVVCMYEFEDREKLRTLPSCGHEFHQQCIDQWLKDHRTCPICRIELRGQ